MKYVLGGVLAAGLLYVGVLFSHDRHLAPQSARIERAFDDMARKAPCTVTIEDRYSPATRAPADIDVQYPPGLIESVLDVRDEFVRENGARADSWTLQARPIHHSPIKTTTNPPTYDTMNPFPLRRSVDTSALERLNGIEQAIARFEQQPEQSCEERVRRAISANARLAEYMRRK